MNFTNNFICEILLNNCKGDINMNKKKSKILLISSLVAVASIGTVSLSLLSNNEAFKLEAGSGENYTHTVFFTSCTPSAYDEDNYRYDVSVSSTIKDKDENSYSIESVDSCIWCDKNAVKFNEGGLIKIASYDGETVYFQFDLIDRATVDLDKSVVSYTVDGEYGNEKFTGYDGGVEGRTSYYAEPYLYSYFGEEIIITEVKLVFTCVQ